jgi:hypothetical protein
MRQEIGMASVAKNRDAVEMLKIAAKNVKDKAAQKAISEALGSKKGGKAQKSAKAPKAAPKASQQPRKATSSNDDKARKFGLSDERLAELRKLKPNSRNPYREGSSYHAVTQILLTRFGSMLPLDKIIAEYPKIVGAEAFKAFKAKAARNDETGKDWQARIRQNLDVCRRESDYGLPLVQCGLEIRREKSDKGIAYGIFQRNGK